MARHNVLGKWGEQVAVDELAGKGYAIAERNWKCGSYEIDIIAYHGNRIIFVEVKTRACHYEHPEDAVDRRRMARLVRAADLYINMHDIPHEVQYDIVAVTGSEHDYRVYHIADAFYAPLHTYGSRR